MIYGRYIYTIPMVYKTNVHITGGWHHLGPNIGEMIPVSATNFGSSGAAMPSNRQQFLPIKWTVQEPD